METILRKQEAPSNVPSRIIFEITQRCPFNCEGCFALGDTIFSGPSYSDIVTIGKKCVDAEVPSISWTGGDPYIRKDFLSAIKAIKKYDAQNRIVHTVDTEGVFINSEVAKQSADIFKLARVSIYGSKDTFHKWTNASSNISWETPYTAIARFLENGLPVQINIPVYSLEDLNPTIEMLNNKFKGNPLIQEVVFIPRIDPGQELDSNEKFPSTEVVKNFIAKMEQSKFSIRYFEWKPGKHIVIKADGLAYAHPVVGQPNGLLQIGNPLSESIHDLWKKFPQNFVEDHRNLTPDVSYLNK